MSGEQRACEEHLLVPEDYFRELRKEVIFSQEWPLELDVGCGDGGFLLAMAAAYPERHFLGIERLLGRARKVCRKAARQDLGNVKVLRLESLYTLEYLLPPASVSRLHLLFPDPWPKKKHRQRRLVQPTTVTFFARVLEPGGEFLFKTDDAAYFEEAREAIAGSKFFRETDWPEEAFFYPQTDFEQHWLAQGKPIQQARFAKFF